MTPAPALAAEDRALGAFRLTTAITLVATFVLVVIGGIVRVSDSGLGCGPAGSGTHGWPLCEGGLVPAASAASVVEYSHRIAAAVVTVLIGLLIWQALRRLRDQRRLVAGSVVAGVLVLVQAGLGGLTVEHGLEELLVAAHLALAMVLLGLLLLLRRWSTTAPLPAPRRRSVLGALTALAAALVLVTVTTGGWVAGTEGHGTPDQPVAGQAHVACGTGWSTRAFPGCIGRFPGFGQSRLADIQLVHRSAMYLAAAAVLAMAAAAMVAGAASPAFALAAFLLLAQVALGALNVWLGKHAGLIVGHLALGTLLWMVVVQAGASLLPGVRGGPAASSAG